MAQLTALGLKQGSIFGHCNRLVGGAYFQLYVDARGLCQLYRYSLPDIFFESRNRDGEFVVTARQLSERVVPGVSADRLIERAGVHISAGDGSVRHHGSRWIGDGTGDGASVALCERT